MVINFRTGRSFSYALKVVRYGMAKEPKTHAFIIAGFAVSVEIENNNYL
jgi:hypothetical protein